MPVFPRTESSSDKKASEPNGEQHEWFVLQVKESINSHSVEFNGVFARQDMADAGF